MDVKKKVVEYTDERLARMGHELQELHAEERVIKRRIRELEREQEAYLSSIRTKTHVGTKPNPLEQQFFSMFSASLAGTDVVVLSTVYNFCVENQIHVSSWRSEDGESMSVAFQRRMDQLGGAAEVGESIPIPVVKRWSIIVCGSRNWPIADKRIIKNRLEKFEKNTRLIHGGNGYYDDNGKLERGADMIADLVAKELGWPPARVFPFKKNMGKAGGPIRNTEMLTELIRRRDQDGDEILVIGFHPNLSESRGTLDMLTQATKGEVPIEIVHN